MFARENIFAPHSSYKCSGPESPCKEDTYMKRFVIAIMASALALTLLLAGCGSSGSDVKESPSTAPTSTVAPDDPENVPSDLNADDTANPTE